MTNNIRTDNWPRAIMHVDCDSFFASVEQSIHPELKGRPVVTGAERGIVTAASVEAKMRGVSRGMTLSEVREACPDVVMVESDYETYTIFSKRLFEILRRYTPIVDEYSIDEAFADMTGMRRLWKMSYGEIALEIQRAVEKELSIGVSIGVSLSKSLSKLCSKFRKPLGITTLPGKSIHELLKMTDIDEVWGVGPASAALLRSRGIKTAFDFVKKPREFAEQLMGKIGIELHMELSGESVYKLNTEAKDVFASLSKARTFTPPSKDAEYVFAQAMQNLEEACAKARRYKLAAKKITLGLRRNDFTSRWVDAKLDRASCSPLELGGALKNMFRSIYTIGSLYRQTTIILSDIVPSANVQYNLFEEPLAFERSLKACSAVDEINERFGSKTIFMATGLKLVGREKVVRGVVRYSSEKDLPNLEIPFIGCAI